METWGSPKIAPGLLDAESCPCVAYFPCEIKKKKKKRAFCAVEAQRLIFKASKHLQTHTSVLCRWLREARVVFQHVRLN